MNPADIRQALVETLQAADLPVNVYAYGQTAVTPPFLVVRSNDPYITFHETWNRAGVQALHFRLEVQVASRPEDAERLLDELVTWGVDEPRSIFEALKADRTLGGTVSTVMLTSATGVSESEYGWTTALTLDVYP